MGRRQIVVNEDRFRTVPEWMNDSTEMVPMQFANSTITGAIHSGHREKIIEAANNKKDQGHIVP